MHATVKRRKITLNDEDLTCSRRLLLDAEARAGGPALVSL